MRSLPDTECQRLSLHARGDDPLLTITVPGDPDHYRQLWSVFWSYTEKPHPGGYFQIQAPGLEYPYDAITFDITEPGFKHVILGANGPIFPKGQTLNFVLGGRASRKELAVVVR